MKFLGEFSRLTENWTVKYQPQINSITSILLILVCCTVGCRAVSHSPFATSTIGKSEPSRTESAVTNSVPIAPGVQSPAANDAVSQQLTAESKALSGSGLVPSNPEMAKYASIRESNDDLATGPDAPVRPQAFDSSSSSSRSGCSGGCCH